VENIGEELQRLFAKYGVQVLGAIVILILGLLAAKFVRKIVRRVMTKVKADPALISFVGHLAYIAMVTFVIIAALAQVGIQTASFIAVIGAAGLAVGLALQGALANFASGVLLLVFRPFRVDDLVEAAGVLGVVEEIQIFTTILRTPDNKKVIVPNAKLTGDNIINYTAKDTRRVDMVIGVSYDADLKKAKDVMTQVLAADQRVLKDPEPTVAVLELADSSVNFVVRPWAKTEDYWDVLFDNTQAIKERLDAEGIGIPFPQQDVHLYQHP